MKFATDINPLVNPIAHGDQVNVHGDIFTCKTNMQCQWEITQDGELVTEPMYSQVDLCAWFINRAGLWHK